jgi:GDP-mannose 6-dehydrogenase
MDTSAEVRDSIARGLSPIREADVAGLIAQGHAAGRLSVAISIHEVVDADVAFVCVGTQGRQDGTLDLSALTMVARDLGGLVRLRSPEAAPLLLVFRSTMLPGTMTSTVLPAVAAAAGEPPGRRYHVAYHPEFTREGSAVADYLAPARIVIGECQPGSAAVLVNLLAGIGAPIFTTSFAVAELVKVADNAFHALKVAFANEVGRFALKSGVLPEEVFEIFLADTKLNLSASYLRPGGPFGGPCLPKDLRALAARMREVGTAAPVIGNIGKSNSLHTDFLVAEIERRVPPGARVLLVGLSFKAGTDDVRESPFVLLAGLLLERGYTLSIYDADLRGCSLQSARRELPPRIAAAVLTKPPAEDRWDLVVVGKETPGWRQCLADNPEIFRIDRL